MKQIICTARNQRFALDDDGGLIPEIEAVLTLSEKQVEYCWAGLTSIEKTETVRFLMAPETARAIATKFTEWADEIEEHANKVARTVEQ